MECSKDGKAVRRYSFDNWMDVDPKTGLVALDEGLYFHFKETRDGVQVSIRTKRWWGSQVLYRETAHGAAVTSPEDLLELSCLTFHYFRGGVAHNQYKAELLRKSRKQAKFMGSYEDRNVRDVDTV